MADTLIAYLHSDEYPASFGDCWLALLAHDSQHGRHIGPFGKQRCAAGGVPEGRNALAAQTLEEDVDWLFFIDSDMGFAPDTLERLHAAADPVHRPIVGGLCFAQREVKSDGMCGYRCEARPTIYDFVEHPDGHRRFTGRAHYPVNELTPVAGTGGACLLIHRSVLEAVADAYGPMWFDRVPGSDGKLLGEDISFFVRTGALQIPAFVHTGIRTTHFKHLWLSETDFWKQFVAPPATDPVTVIVPVLSRPDNVAPLVTSLRASTGLADVIFVAEPDDPFEWAAISKAGARQIVHPGTFAQKVNAAMEHVTTSRIFITGDDVVFRPGWLDHLQFFADKYGAKVIGANDLGNPRVMAGEHATHMLIDVEYINELGASWDGPGVVCHEGYRHWFVDDELVTVAKQRGVFQVALGSIVEHMHPIFGKAKDDDIYQLGQSHAQQDAATFKKRFVANAA